MSLSRHYFRKAFPRSVSFPPPTYLFTVSPAYSQSHSESLYALSESLPRQRRQFAQSPFNQIIRYWYCGVSEGVWKRSVCSSTTYCQTDVWYPYKDKKPIVRSQEYSANTVYWHIMIQVSVRKYKSSVKFTCRLRERFYHKIPLWSFQLCYLISTNSNSMNYRVCTLMEKNMCFLPH